MKTVSDVLAAFEVAALNAGLARNTRKTYAGTIHEFTTMLKAGQISGPQDYFHTSGGNTVRSPLDTAAERIIPFVKSA